MLGSLADKKWCVVAALALLVLAGPAANAGSVTGKFVNVDPGKAVKINMYGFRVWAGIYNWKFIDPVTPPPDDTFWTVCIEPTQELWYGATVTYDVVSLDQPLDSTKAALIKELWAEKMGTIVNPLDPTDDFDAAAFQLTVWEFIQETSGTYDITNGSFSLDTGAYNYGLESTVNQWISDTLDAGTPDADVKALINDSVQDQAIIGGSLRVVPLPPAAWGGMALLVGMGGIVRLRRKLRPQA